MPRVRTRMACEHAAMLLGSLALVFGSKPEEPRTSVSAADDTIHCPSRVAELPSSPLFDPADPRLRSPALLVVHKSERRLMLFARGSLKHCLRIGLGFEPRGDKRREGDGKTPEGWYRTSDKPWSSFAAAIAVHYPNVADAHDAHRGGLISRRVRDEIVTAHDRGRIPPQRTTMGGEILIHGGGSTRDWTLGCVALDDDDLNTLRRDLPRTMRTDLLVLP